jgi:hypothetical protein
MGVRKTQYLFEDQRAGGPIYVNYIKLARNRLSFGCFRRLNLAKILAISINRCTNIVRDSLGNYMYRREHFSLIHNDLC